MIHEASLINEETISDVGISVLNTDRNTMKVSMIKRNNQIIYQNSKMPVNPRKSFARPEEPS